MKIEKVGDVATGAGIKATIYGRAGEGKTFSISTIPNPETVLIFSAEAGLLSIRKIAADMDVVTINSIDDLREGFAFLEKGKDKYKTIVLDSLSEIAQQVLSFEMSGDKVDGRAAYGNMAETVMALAKSFRDLHGRNVILICQEERIQDDSGRLFFGPSMPGRKVGSAITYLTDLVFAIRSRPDGEGGLDRAFQTSSLANEQYVAKDRSGCLKIMETPDWSIIFNKINGE